MSRARLRPGGLLVAGALLATATACGQQAAPSESAPELSERLEAVERSIAKQDYASAGEALQKLVRTAAAAKEAGDLSEVEAEAITVTARRLFEKLPG